jgi:hypothetical protein
MSRQVEIISILWYYFFMSAFEEQPVIGLFGTCGDSTFRQELFIPIYDRLSMPYFNPQVDDWRPEFADIESDHLAHDVVQCWPVLGSTYGAGSLAEQGYAIASSLRTLSPLPKFVIPMIEMDLSGNLTDQVARRESERARKLAATHLSNNASPNVYLVSSLDEMLETSISLYGAARALVELGRAKNPAYTRFIEGRQASLAFAEALRAGKLGKDASTVASRSQK